MQGNLQSIFDDPDGLKLLRGTTMTGVLFLPTDFTINMLDLLSSVLDTLTSHLYCLIRAVNNNSEVFNLSSSRN